MVNDICVVITAFNAADTIARALQSALAQPEVSKVVVVDDASSDGTSQIALQCDDGSKRIKVIPLERNVGPSTARNIAIAEGAGAFIAILDADDWFVPGRFAAIDDGDWDLLADNILFVHEERHAREALKRVEGARSRVLTFEEFLERNIARRNMPKAELGFLKPVIRRTSWSRLGLSYNAQVRLGEDFILYATALARGGRFVLQERSGYVAQVQPGSLSSVHRTADLEALAEADRDLLGELMEAGAPHERVTLLRRHLVSIERKTAIRSLLDRRHQVGVVASMLELVPRPNTLAYATTQLVLDKLRRKPSTSGIKHRTLMLPHEF